MLDTVTRDINHVIAHAHYLHNHVLIALVPKRTSRFPLRSKVYYMYAPPTLVLGEVGIDIDRCIVGSPQ